MAHIGRNLGEPKSRRTQHIRLQKEYKTFRSWQIWHTIRVAVDKSKSARSFNHACWLSRRSTGLQVFETSQTVVQQNALNDKYILVIAHNRLNKQLVLGSFIKSGGRETYEQMHNTAGWCILNKAVVTKLYANPKHQSVCLKMSFELQISVNQGYLTC